MGEGTGEAWVFHAGALGDFVLVWPLVRALARRFEAVHVVAEGEKAGLAASCIEPRGAVVAHDVQNRGYTRLWTGEPAPAADVRPDAALVINFVADAGDCAAWTDGARSMFPRASTRYVGPPGSVSRARAWEELGVAERGRVARAGSAGGPVLCHVGAGSWAKRWPLERWRALRDDLAGRLPLRFIAGEVEAERFSAAERREFESLGGEVCGSLARLAVEIRAASVFVGADTGPTHLAAQLGVVTVALFGPTDPGVWGPVGPCVRVIAPRAPEPMTWLGQARVRETLVSLISNDRP